MQIVENRAWREIPAIVYWILNLVICAGCISFCHYRVTGEFSIAVLCLVVLVLGSSVFIGNAFLRLFGVLTGNSVEFSLGLVIGYGVLSTILLLAKLVVPMTAAAGLLALIGILLFFSLIISRGSGLPKSSCRETYAILLVTIGVLLWGQQTTAPPIVQENFTIFEVWEDYFSNAARIATFKPSILPQVFGSFERSGEALRPYHYAAHVIPAAVSDLASQQAILVVKWFLVPVGVLLGGLSAFAIVTRLCGSGAALFAVLILFYLPDSSYYGLSVGWFGYNWLLQISPTLSYGVALAVVALTILDSACEQNTYLSLVGVILVGFCALCFKVQIFAVFAPVAVAYWLFNWQRRGAVFFLVALITVVGILLVSVPSALPLPQRFDGSATREYTTLVFNRIGSEYWRQVFSPVLTSSGSSLAIYGVFLIAAGTFGGWLFMLPLLPYLVWRLRLNKLTLISGLALITYLAFALLLSKHSGLADSWELHHRVFVFCYFFWVCLGGAALHQFLGKRGVFSRYPCGALVAFLAIALVSVPSILGKRVHYGTWEVNEPFVNHKVPNGIAALAAYINLNLPFDGILIDPLGDKKLFLAGLSEQRMYLAREGYGHYSKSADVNAAVALRRGKIDALFKADTVETLTPLVAELDDPWVIVPPEIAPVWPQEVLSQPIYSAEGYRLYHLVSANIL